MASSMFQLTYGYHLDDKSDPFFAGLMEAMYNKFKAIMYTSKYQKFHVSSAERPLGRLLRQLVPSLGSCSRLVSWGKVEADRPGVG